MADTLVHQFTARSGQPNDVRGWMIFISFDVTGAIAVGKNFRTLKDRKSKFSLDFIESGMAAFLLLTPIRWKFPLLACLPRNPLNISLAWYEELVEERRKASTI